MFDAIDVCRNHLTAAGLFHVVESASIGQKNRGPHGSRLQHHNRHGLLSRGNDQQAGGRICAKFLIATDVSTLGSVLSGAMGIQGHFANGLAALYIACGQDAACVAESAVGVTRIEVTAEGDLYAAVTLPNIIVGTVGGGTGLPGQRACLDIMGLAGPDSARALAEICGGLCLAGELSIAAAVCGGHFSRAHRLLGRRRDRQMARYRNEA